MDKELTCPKGDEMAVMQAKLFALQTEIKEIQAKLDLHSEQAAKGNHWEVANHKLFVPDGSAVRLHIGDKKFVISNTFLVEEDHASPGLRVVLEEIDSRLTVTISQTGMVSVWKVDR